MLGFTPDAMAKSSGIFKRTALRYSRDAFNPISLGEHMDPITSAIVAALAAGAISGLTDTSKAAITNAYEALKDLLAKKFGIKSHVVQAVDHLEAKPEWAGLQEELQEEIVAVHGEHDIEVLAAAKHLLTLVQLQQANLGKFTIQNNAPVQGQTIGDHTIITQQFGERPNT
jgi:hypothetical protein